MWCGLSPLASLYASDRACSCLCSLPLVFGPMEPARKAARQSCLQTKLPYISSNALSAMLKLAREEELPEATSVRSLRRSRDRDVEVATPYGLLHQQVDVAGTMMEMQHPLAMLCHLCKISKGVSELVKPLSSSPASPLRIVVYADEVHPGSPLAVTADRKLWVFYWSLLDFGASVLSHEDVFSHTCMIIHVVLHGSWFVWGFRMLQHVACLSCILSH